MAFSRTSSLNPKGEVGGVDKQNYIIDIKQLPGSKLIDYQNDINNWVENEFVEDLSQVTDYLLKGKNVDQYFHQGEEVQDLLNELQNNTEFTADAAEAVMQETETGKRNLVFSMTPGGLTKAIESVANIVDKQRAVKGLVYQYIQLAKQGEDVSVFFEELFEDVCTCNLVNVYKVARDESFNINKGVQIYEAWEHLLLDETILNDIVFKNGTLQIDQFVTTKKGEEPESIPDDCTVPSVAMFEHSLPSFSYRDEEHYCGDCNTPEEFEEFRKEKQWELENTMVGYNPEVIFCIDESDNNIEASEFIDDNDKNQERALNRITKQLAPYLNNVKKARGKDKEAVKHLAHSLKRIEDRDGVMQVGRILHLLISKYNTGDLQNATVDQWKDRGTAADLDMNGNGLFRKNDAKYMKKMADHYVAFRNNEQGFPVYKSVMFMLTKELTVSGIIDNPDQVMTTHNADVDMIALWNRENNMMNDILDKRSDSGEVELKFTNKDKKAIRRWAQKGEKRAMKKVAKMFENGKMTKEKMISLLNGQKRYTKDQKEFLDAYNNGGNVAKLADALAAGMSPAEAYRAHLILNNAELNCSRFEAMGIADKSRQKTYGALHMMGDRNLDGKKSESDGDIVTGLQMENIFIGSVTDIKHFGMDALGLPTLPSEEENLKQIEDKIICHITQYVVQIAQSQGLHNLTQHLLVGGQNAQGEPFVIDNGEELYYAFQQNPGLVKLYQDVLLQSPMPLNYIMTHGRTAAESYHDEVQESMYEQIEGQIDGELSAESIALIDQNANKRWNKLTKDTDAMGLGLNETVYNQFKTNFSAFALAMVDPYKPSVTGAAGSVAMSTRLAQFFGDTGQLNLTAMVGGLTDGRSANGMLGIGISYNQKLWKGAHLDAFGGAAGFGPAPLAFMPIGQIGLTQDIDITNEAKLRNSLKPGSRKTLQFGPHIAMIGPIPAIGGKVGVHHDKLSGIEDNYESLRGSMRGIAKSILDDSYDSITNPNGIRWNLRNKKVGQYETERQKNIGRIQKHLSGLKGPSNLRRQAAENVYKSFQYFGANSDLLTRSSAHDFFVDTLADYYAVEWRNREMAGMNGKRQYSGRQVGVDFLAGFFPIPSAAIYLTKHKELTREDGEIGKQRVAIAEKEGLGNYRITQENEITEVALDWMNEVVEDIFQGSPHETMLDANDMKLEDVNADGKEDFLIPESLWESDLLNLKIDPIMKGHMVMHQDADTGIRYIAIDKQVPVRFMRGYMGRSRVVVLNIGDTNTEKGDLALRRGVDIPADYLGNNPSLPPQFATKKSDVLTPGGINMQLSQLQADPRFAGFPLGSAIPSDVPGYVKFSWNGAKPTGLDGNTMKFAGGALYVQAKNHTGLTITRQDGGYALSCVHSNSGTGLQLTYAVSAVSEAITQECLDTTWLASDTTMLPFDKPLVKGNNLHISHKKGMKITWKGKNISQVSPGVVSIPKTSDINIKKTGGNTYEISVGPSTQGFMIDILQQTPGIPGTPGTKRETMKPYGSMSNVFESDKNTLRGQIDSELDKPQTYKALRELENAHPKSFKNFMISLASIDKNGLLDNAEITNALKHLNGMLTKANVANLKLQITDIVTVGDMEAQSYLCLRMRTIFAMEPGYNQYKLSQLFAQRKNTYKTLPGLNNKALPAGIDIRGVLMPKLQGHLNKKFSYAPQAMNNLVGFTAFYRASVGHKFGRRGMTPPGGTNVYAGITETVPNTEELRDWFSENLLKNKFESDVFISLLRSKVPAAYQHLIQPTHIKDYLAGNVVKIEKEGVKLQIKGNFKAYLLSECANESIGFAVEEVLISHKTETPGTPGTPGEYEEKRIMSVSCEEDGSCSESVSVKTSEQQEGEGGLRVNTPESWSVNNFAGKNDLPLGLALVGRRAPDTSTQPSHGESEGVNTKTQPAHKESLSTTGSTGVQTEQGATRPGGSTGTSGSNNGTRSGGTTSTPSGRVVGLNELGGFTQTQNEQQLNKRRGKSRRRR